MSWGCGSSTSDSGRAPGGAGGAAGDDASGASDDGGSSHGGSSHGGAGQSGGAAAGAGADARAGDAGQAGNADELGAGSAGANGLGEGGAAGQSAGTARFEPWALWPMPNAASAGLPNPASYDTSTDGVVLDQVTGLIWQANVSSDVDDWQSAQAYCATLSLAGRADWRLPSRIELMSIVDETVAKPGPVIDGAAFPDAPNTLFWTASLLATNTDRAWYVEFDNGFAFSDSISAEYSVRCVSSPRPAEPPAMRYAISDGLVTDTETGLVWQQTDAGGSYTFAAAQQHCADLGGGFRAPSVKELLTLVDESRAYPAADPSVFTSIPTDNGLPSCYQTSTPLAGTSISWLVCFDEGRPTYDSVNDAYRVLCVR